MYHVSVKKYTVAIFIVLAVMILAGGPILGFFMDSDYFRIIGLTYFSVLFLVAGSPGILFILRKEAMTLGLRSIYGTRAVVNGIMWVCVFYIPLIVSLITFFR
jgi:hypothetical protein